MILFDFNIGKSIALYSYFAGFLTFGIVNHFRRCADFYRVYGEYTYLVMALNCFAIFYVCFLDSTHLVFSLPKMSVVLGCIFVPSLIIFEVSIYSASRIKLLLFDFSTLFLLQALIIFWQNDYVWFVTGILSQFKLVWVLRSWPRITNNDEKPVSFRLSEFVYSFFSTIFAVIPTLIVTNIFLGADMVSSFWILLLLRLTSSMSLISNASFNFIKAQFGSAARLVPKVYHIYSTFVFLFIEFIIYLVVHLDFVADVLYAAVVPFVAFSGTWTKQNIQYEIGSSPLLIFNFLLSLCCVLLAFFELGVLYFYLTFIAFYTLGINLWYYLKHSN